MKRNCVNLVASALAAALLCVASTTWAQVAPPLGVAQQFGVLGGAAVTGSTGAGTLVNGDVGSFPTPAITNFPPSRTPPQFTVHRTANSTVQQAQTDARAAYNFLAAQGGSALPVPPAPDELGGRTLGPGVYSLGAANLAGGTTLRLDGAGVFIFNVASTLTMNVGSAVVGTANPCNVFWRVGTSATLNGTAFLGTVIADISITLGGGNVSGRLLALTGAVDMPGAGGNTIGGCSTPAPPVCPAITLSPATLPNGSVGIPYSQTIVGSGGTAPYTFTVTGGALPGGLTLAATGVLSGTPTTAGTFTATIRGTDANGCFAERTYTIIIAAAPPPPPPGCPVITLNPPTLPNGIVGAAYSQTLVGSGGTAPYTFIGTVGVLPPGLVLTPAGVLAGTPTTAGTFTGTIRATDANGCFAERSYAIIIDAAPPPPPGCPVITLNPPTLPNGTVGVAYTQTILGSGGTAPYTFGVIAGLVPAGLVLTPAGLLAGTPTTAGSSTFTIRGTDANGCFAIITYTIVIAAAPPPPPVCPPITFTPPTLPNGTVGVAYSQTLTGSGGNPPYNFGVVSGALPPGLTLSPSSPGILAGTPTTVGTSVITIRATDANGCFAERAFTIIIAAAPAPPPTCPPITLSPATLPNGTVGVFNTVTITGSGGTGPYVFGVTSGALPGGVTLTPAGVVSGTPTTVGTSTFTIRGTDANGCFLERTFTVSIITAVPTLPQVFVLLLALGLAGAGYYRLRRRAHMG